MLWEPRHVLDHLPQLVSTYCHPSFRLNVKSPYWANEAALWHVALHYDATLAGPEGAYMEY